MTKEKLNLGAAFDKLKNKPDKEIFTMLVRAEQYLKDPDQQEFKYAYAYGMLAGAIKAYLIAETPLYYKDIEEAVAANDEKQGR